MSSLNAEQALAVKHIRGPMLVLAGPGSGKTFTLVERIRNLIENEGINPHKILVITFSKKAALEMQARFNNLIKDKCYPVTFGTFHAIFYHILKCHKNYSKDSILTPKQKRNYLGYIAKKHNLNELLIESVMEDYLSKISYFKTSNLTENEKIEYLALDDNEKSKFLLVYKEYIKYCKEDNKIDFDDMLYQCLFLLKSNKKILNEWQNVYKYFLVDEFQDINDVQYEVLKLLAGDEFNIFAVGDDDQSIYGFRGSKPALMKEFMDIPTCKTVNLNKNYRCAEEIINIANKLIKNNVLRIDKNQIAAKSDKKDGFVKLLCVENIDKEAEYVVDIIKNKDYSDKNLNSTAILYRNRKCADFIEEKLMLSGIQYERKNESCDFYDSEVMLDLIAYFKVCTNNGTRTDFYRILNKPDRELTREVFNNNIGNEILKLTDIDRLYNSYEEMKPAWDKLLKNLKMLESLPCYAAINYLFKGIGYEQYMNVSLMKKGVNKEKIEEITEEIFSRSRNFENVRAWLKYINEINVLKENNVGNYDGIVDNKNNIKNDNMDNEHNGLHKVVLQTMHASKGLEYENVFIVGLQEGIFPSKKSVTDEQIEEERRLFYVAITRAKKHLYIIGRGDNEHGKHISRFVSEIIDS